MAWFSIVALACAVSLGLAWVSRLGMRRLWQAVGIVALVLAATLPFTGGSIDYRIGCGAACGGTLSTNVWLVLIDALLVGAILSLPDRLARWLVRAGLAAGVSLAFLVLTALRIVT